MIAINGTEIEVVKSNAFNFGHGVFFVYEGTPIALYKASNITDEGVDLLLVDGIETDEIKSVLYS